MLYIVDVIYSMAEFRGGSICVGRRVVFHGFLTFFGGFLLVWGEDCGFGDGWALSYNSLKF